MEVSQDQLLSFTRGRELWKVTPQFAPVFRLNFNQGIEALIEKPWQCLKKGKQKAIYLLRLKAENKTQEFFLKVYYHYGISRWIKPYLKHPRGTHEFYTGLQIIQRNISTIVPCAGGIKKRGGAILESYFLSEKMAHTENFNLFLLRESPNGDLIPTNRSPIMENLGVLIRTMHAMGVLQKDLAPNNFLLGIGKGNYGKFYLVDYERVKIIRSVPEAIQKWVLSKLNRIGLEVSLSDRFHFLHAYRPELDKEAFKKLAKEINGRTVFQIKKDISRPRMSNVYIAARYLFFQQDDYWGFCRKGYDLNSLLMYISQPEKADSSKHGIFFWRKANSQSSEKIRINKGSKKNSPEKLWAIIWGLKLARIPVISPVALVAKRGGKKDGFLVMPVRKDTKSFQDFLRIDPNPEAKKVLHQSLIRIMEKLHQFGTFSGELSGEEFLIEENTKGKLRIYLQDLSQFALYKSPDNSLISLDIKSINALFS